MSRPLTAIEKLARQLCRQRWGAGHWHGGGTNRGYWRRQARKALAA